MSAEGKTGSPPELVDHDAEDALLGAALLDYRVFTAFDVAPDDFSDARWRALWTAGQELAEQGVRADQITLPDDVMSVVGGAATLVDLVNACPSAVQAGDYALIVKEKAAQRQTLEIADWVARAAHKDPAMRRELVRKALERGRALLAEADGSTADWPVYTLADAYADRDPLTYVVADLFSLPSLSIVYGPPGCLKSMLMADCALCVAAGLPWLPSQTDDDQVFSRATVRVPTLWCDFDNGKRRTDERIEALARAQELDAEATAFYYVSMPFPWLNGGDADSVDSLIERVSIMSVGLVIVDNLGTVSGDADENSADMVHVLANFRRLAEETGAAVVLIHHQRKATSFKSRAGESLRGHSSIEAALDLALLVEREERADMVTLKSTKTRGVDVSPFGAVFTYKHKIFGHELAEARFYGQVVLDQSPSACAWRAVLEAVEESTDALSKGALVKAAKELADDVGVNRLRDAIDRLTAEGKLAMTPGARNARYYTLPG